MTSSRYTEKVMIEPQIIGNLGFIFKLPIRVKSAISSSFFRVYTEKRNRSVVFPQSLLQSLVMDSILPEKLKIPPLSSQTFILSPTATQQPPNKWESAWPTASNHVLAKLSWVGVMLSYFFLARCERYIPFGPFPGPCLSRAAAQDQLQRCLPASTSQWLCHG